MKVNRFTVNLGGNAGLSRPFGVRQAFFIRRRKNVRYSFFKGESRPGKGKY